MVEVIHPLSNKYIHPLSNKYSKKKFIGGAFQFHIENLQHEDFWASSSQHKLLFASKVASNESFSIACMNNQK